MIFSKSIPPNSGIMMPELGGMDLLKIIRDNYPRTRVIIITGFGTVNSAVESMKRGAADFIQKPFTPAEIRNVLNKYLPKKDTATSKTLQFNRDGQVATIIGVSPVMQDIYDLVLKVAPTDSTVLITGETGVGKELIARAIHFHSQRKEQAFLTVDCCSLVESLFESELFGHVKGSFTGAIATKHGSFELANGGTFFFDEIGNISLNIQAKILRAIQEREIKRVGDTATIKVDVRVIAATNRDLSQAVAEGGFREDLFYRLSVIPIHVPGLRQRREDIIPLAEHFLEKYNQKRKKSLSGFNRDVEQLFIEYYWPGNVRELENVVERAVVIEDKQTVTVPSLPSNIRNLKSKPMEKEDSVKSLEQLEREHILSTLEQTNWNRSKSARLLGIDRKTLYDKLKRYRIEK
ncbi:MAG TPA: sigma-54-dependent Fis family transcriptional regulator [bacterium]|nr:sigma-54-dependent Fis family transcriptional regulator [bacterium]HDP97958.1 sigma-54-dependent Fis family transcriptional regulator [bacterium]